MSRATVRAAIYDFFQPPAVLHLNTLFRAAPKFVPESDPFDDLPAGIVESGAVGWIQIGDGTETRIAFGGAHSGKKMVVNNITLLCGFWSVQDRLEDAEDDHDAFVEAFKLRLRSNRNLARPESVIFEAGERGGIRTKHDVLILNSNGASFRWTRFEFQVVEILTT